jgi:hypothetical protein
MRFLTLALVSLVFGILAARLFRMLTDPPKLRRATNQIIAHILEFSLFVDEPRIILRAQLELIRANLRLLRQIAVPCLLVAAMFALLYLPCDRSFGRGPLQVNEPVVVTMHGDQPSLRLVPPPGILVETPGVRIVRTHETSWRIRPIRAGIIDFPATPVPLDVPYPHVQWITWFVLISTAAALLDIKYY